MPDRAQCFTGCGFILGLCGLAVLLSPLTKARIAGGSQNFQRDPQHALLGKFCFALSQANTSIATKAASKKVELQEKIMTSLPSLPRRPKPGLELYLWDFTRQLLQEHCKTLWVEELSWVLALVPGCAQKMAGVLGDLPWMLTEDVSLVTGWALCSDRAFSLFTAKESSHEGQQEKGALLCCMQEKKMKTLQITQVFKLFQTWFRVCHGAGRRQRLWQHWARLQPFPKKLVKNHLWQWEMEQYWQLPLQWALCPISVPAQSCVCPHAGAPVAEQGRRGAAAAGGGALLRGGGHRGGGPELCEDHPQPASCGTYEVHHILRAQGCAEAFSWWRRFGEGTCVFLVWNLGFLTQCELLVSEHCSSLTLSSSYCVGSFAVVP